MLIYVSFDVLLFPLELVFMVKASCYDAVQHRKRLISKKLPCLTEKKMF